MKNIEDVWKLKMDLGDATIQINNLKQQNDMLVAYIEMLDNTVLKPLIEERSTSGENAKRILNDRPMVVSLNNHDADVIESVCKRLKFATMAYTSDDAKNAVLTVVEVMENEVRHLRMYGG